MSTGSVDIGAIVQGGTGIGQIVAGMLIQDETQYKIKELRKEYPNMSIPEAIVQATDLYRQESERTQLPGYDLYRQQLEQSTAQGISQSREAATSAADLLGATTSLYGQQSQALTQLDIEGSRRQAQMKQAYGQQLNTMGSWQQQQYYMNELYPWTSRMNELQGIQQSAYDMLVGGINTLAASGANMSGGGATYNTPSDNDSWEYPEYNPVYDTSQTPGEQQGTEIDLSGYTNPGGSIWD